MATGETESILGYTRDVEAAPPPAPLPRAYYPGPAGASEGGGSDRKKERLLNAALLAVAVLLVLLVVYHLAAPRTLGARLDRGGWVVYYRKGCGYCDKQKALLSGFSKFIETDQAGKLVGGYTDAPPLPLKSPEIKGYPFWYNTRTRASKMGLQSAADLEKMAA
jgi:hypothetical protein